MRTKCQFDARWFDSDQALDRMNTWLENPLIIKKVVQPLAREVKSPYIHLHCCPDCFQKRVDQVMRENSRQRDILSDDELRYVEPA